MNYTSRDENILQTLGCYGVLSTEQVARMFFLNTAPTTVRRRLRILEDADQIYRVHGLDNGGVAWVLTKNAAARVGCMYPIRHFNRNSLTHDVALSEVRNVLERSGLCSNWVPEHVLKTQANVNRSHSTEEKPFVPDAIFSMKQKNETRVVALELELHGKNQKRYENILSRYQRKKTLWAVWYLVPNEGLGKALERVWSKINGKRRNDLLMWSILPQFLRDPLNACARSEYFSYSLREFVNTKTQAVVPALAGALPEIKVKNKTIVDVESTVF